MGALAMALAMGQPKSSSIRLEGAEAEAVEMLCLRKTTLQLPEMLVQGVGGS